MSEVSKPHSELRESLAVAIQDVLLIDSPEGDSPRNIAANLREVLGDLDGLIEQLEASLRVVEAAQIAYDGFDEDDHEFYGSQKRLADVLNTYRAAYPATKTGTTFQWLIERGQPEGLANAEWLEHSAEHPARDQQWTRDAWAAAMFPDRETAERFIEEQSLEARAVEHGFASDPAKRPT